MKVIVQTCIVVLSLLLISCETEITIDLPAAEEKLVVEGRMEEGLPPIVLLSRNVSFYGANLFQNPDSLYVRDAIITVYNETDSVTLLPFEIDTLGQTAIVYSNPFEGFVGERNRTYRIRIEAEGQVLTSVTSIPNMVNVDTLWYEDASTEDNDSIVRAFTFITDPDTLGNYYRFFTSQNGDPFLPGLASTFDDAFINGTRFQTPFDRGENRFEDIDFDIYGFFFRGDTIVLKLTQIDRAHYNFWRTIEDDAATGGPFSTFTIIDGNIDGGLGIWGGYAVSLDTIIIPE